MRDKKITSLAIITLTFITVSLMSDETEHANMDHAKHMMQMSVT